MGSTVRGFTVRDLTQHGKPEVTHCTVNFGKTLPATTTGNLFAISGIIVVTGLVGVVSTVLQAVAVKPSIGVTGLNAAIAAQPAVAYNATAVGSVVQMPTALGGALPAPVVASGAASSSGQFVVSAANITITTDATVTGAITWCLYWQPLYPKSNASVTAV